VEQRRFCSNCGNPLEGNVNFCPACGQATGREGNDLGTVQQGTVSQQKQGQKDWLKFMQNPLLHSFFTMEGRLNRWAFFKKEMVILSLMIVFSVLLSAMFSGGGMVVIIGIAAVVMLGWGMKFFIPEFRQFLKQYSAYFIGFWCLLLLLSKLVNDNNQNSAAMALVMFFGLCMLVCVVSNICVTVRRCHDLDKTGWLVLLGLIPYVNSVFALCMVGIKGTQGLNAYGEDPLQQSDTWDK